MSVSAVLLITISPHSLLSAPLHPVPTPPLHQTHVCKRLSNFALPLDELKRPACDKVLGGGLETQALNCANSQEAGNSPYTRDLTVTAFRFITKILMLSQ